MGIQKSVFASRSERANFRKLSRQWGDRYRLYHNLPYLRVFNVYDGKPLLFWKRGDYKVESRADFFRFEEITEIERARLKKTSIDYTLCDENDQPLLCIEFDGFQDGFNIGQEYRPNLQPSDPWRGQMMQLKLRVAHGNQFPYFVVGYEQFEDLSPGVRLTLIDGVIGDVLANRATHHRLEVEGFKAEYYGMSDADFDALRPDEQREIIEDWALGVEVESSMTYNPVCRARWDLQRELELVGPTSHYFVTYPSADTATTSRERRMLIDNAILNGAETVVHTDDFGDIKRTVWLPNFQTPGFSGLGLLDEMATLVALDTVRRMRAQKSTARRTA